MKQNVSGYWVPLTLAVLTAIGGHFYSMPVVMAENIEFTKGISGQKNNDKFLSQKGVKVKEETEENEKGDEYTVGTTCLLYTSPSPRDGLLSRMPSSA